MVWRSEGQGYLNEKGPTGHIRGSERGNEFIFGSYSVIFLAGFGVTESYELSGSSLQ